MFYRVKQFVKAVTAEVTQEEIKWVRTMLSEKEQTLFFQLKVYEQRHSIDVARHIKQNSLGNIDSEMIRLGLLHDIGKIQYPLNPIEKSIIVILDRLTKGKIKKYTRLKMVQCYYSHAEVGYCLLKEIGDYEACFLECIRLHHSKGVEDRRLLQLMEADNCC